MAKKPTTTKSLENDVAAELEKALDLDLNGDDGGLDMAASMEDLEAQISAAGGGTGARSADRCGSP